MIEGTDVYEFFSCMYKVYNRHNRDKKLMVPFSDFSKKIMELGREHEKTMAAAIEVEQPKYKRSEFKEGFDATVALMKKGSKAIYQGLLMHDDFLGIPDLMIRQEGASKLGKWHYIPAEIKLSTRSKEEQIMQLLFYDMLLETMQGMSSGKGIIILKNSSELVDFSKYKKRFKEALQMVEKLSNGYDYGMHIDTVCKDCAWHDVCIPLAQKNHDVSLVYGLSRPIHYKLIDAGVKTLEDLQEAEPQKLAEIEGITEESVRKWQMQANVVLTKKDKITKIKLPETKHIVALDIENTDEGKVYLIGLFDGTKFKYFHSDNNERKLIDDFIEYFLSLESVSFYHYGSIEKTTFRKLFAEYKIDEEVQKRIFDSMIDLLPIVRKNAVLPVMYYDLKTVAKHLGYTWRSSDASGSNSMVWYQEWLDKKDKDMLKKIVEYNEDDVRATYLIIEKLSK